jgi:hypothetical protein
MARERQLKTARQVDEGEGGPDLSLVAGGFMSVAEATQLSGLSKSEIYNRMTDRSIQYAKHGKRRLIVRNSLLVFMASKLVGATA